MTRDEFQRKYNDHMTRDESDAWAECKKVNAEGIDENYAVAVKFGEHWCLMLGSAVAHLMSIGIKPDGMA